MKKTIIALVILALIAGAGYGGYWYGMNKAIKSQLLIASTNQKTNSYYPKPIMGKPSIPELDSVSQDDITFLTGMNQKGRDGIAEILDGIKEITGMDFNRSYTDNDQLYWNRPSNISYLKWVSMNDQEKVNVIHLCWGQSDCIGNDIRYRMETVLATKDVNYSSDEAQGLFDKVKDYLIKEKSFIDGADDIGFGTPNAVLIKGNLICKISFEPGGFGLINVNNEKINQVKLELGYYDEPISK